MLGNRLKRAQKFSQFEPKCLLPSCYDFPKCGTRPDQNGAAYEKCVRLSNTGECECCP